MDGDWLMWFYYRTNEIVVKHQTGANAIIERVVKFGSDLIIATSSLPLAAVNAVRMAHGGEAAVAARVWWQQLCGSMLWGACMRGCQARCEEHLQCDGVAQEGGNARGEVDASSCCAASRIGCTCIVGPLSELLPLLVCVPGCQAVPAMPSIAMYCFSQESFEGNPRLPSKAWGALQAS